MVNVAQLVELRNVTPVVEGSIPFVHPIFVALVVQLDRIPDSDSGGRRFESFRARILLFA